LVELVNSQMGMQPRDWEKVLLSKKQTYIKQRSQRYAGVLVWSMMVLAIVLTFW